MNVTMSKFCTFLHAKSLVEIEMAGLHQFKSLVVNFMPF